MANKVRDKIYNYITDSTVMIEINHKEKTVEVFPNIDGWYSTSEVEVKRLKFIENYFLLELAISDLIRDIPKNYMVF